MNKARGQRRAARRLAFQVLYGLAFVPATSRSELERAFRLAPEAEGEELPPKGREFAWELVDGVWTRLEELDTLVSRFSQHWKVGRIARVELTILRLALFEMLHRPDIPLKVAINEAIELAKVFGDEHSGNFVNGILDAAARSIEAGEFGIAKDI